MKNLIEGKMISQNSKYAIVVSHFNDFITQKLHQAAFDCLIKHNCPEQNITTVWVPGAFEIPLTLAELALSKNYDGLIALGAIIRGGTPHFDYVASEVAKGVSSVSLEHKIPISFGVLTTDSIEQAIERSGCKHGNKGWDAALTTIQMVNLIKEIRQKD